MQYSIKFKEIFCDYDNILIDNPCFFTDIEKYTT